MAEVSVNLWQVLIEERLKSSTPTWNMRKFM